MVEGLGVHRADDGNIIGDRADVWQDFRHLSASLAVFFELKFGAEEIIVRRDKGGLVVLQEFSRWLGTIKSGELRFIVKEIEMAGSTTHVEEDDILGFARKVRLLWRHGIGGACLEGSEGDPTEAEAAFFEKPSA